MELQNYIDESKKQLNENRIRFLDYHIFFPCEYSHLNSKECQISISKFNVEVGNALSKIKVSKTGYNINFFDILKEDVYEIKKIFNNYFEKNKLEVFFSNTVKISDDEGGICDIYFKIYKN